MTAIVYFGEMLVASLLAIVLLAYMRFAFGPGDRLRWLNFARYFRHFRLSG
jgi:hypothetical protein